MVSPLNALPLTLLPLTLPDRDKDGAEAPSLSLPGVLR